MSQLNRYTGPHTNKFLASYASGTYVYDTYTLAKDACSARADCKGVTRQPGLIYTLRTGLVLVDSGSGEVSWQKSSGGFTGPQPNKFLASYASGTYVYNTETLAKNACSLRTDCNGVTQESVYTLRTGLVLFDSGTTEVSWQKSSIYTGPHTNKFLAFSASEPNVYTSETLAKNACAASTDCNGVTQESEYTLRTGLVLNDSLTTEVSWQKSTIANSVLDLVGILGNIRKVRVQLEGSNYVHMREIQVFDKNGVNVALNKNATQSGTTVWGDGGPASKAVNGDVTDFGSFSGYQAGKYFIYHLQQPMYIYRFIQYILTCFLLYIKVHGGRWTWEQM